MIDYSEYFAYLKTTALADVVDEFATRTDLILEELSHGDFNKWQMAVDTLPEFSPIDIDMGAATVSVGCPGSE